MYVYIMASKSKVLYTGVTNDLERRVSEHKLGEGSSFTKKYKCVRLVYYECFNDPEQAIEREKAIKGLTRAKKLALINEANPAWLDLSQEWYRE